MKCVVLHPDRELVYHLKISGIVCLWFAVSWACHWLRARERDALWSHHFWLAADVALLTALLASLETPLGLLLGSYLALIAVAGLFFQPRLVAFTTAIAVAGAIVLFALRPEEAAVGGTLPLDVPLTATCPGCEGTGGAVFDCMTCGGEGKVQRRLPVPVRIPPGVRDGTIFQVSLDDPAVLSIILTIHIRAI